MGLGILIGFFFNDFSARLNVLSDIFLRLIKMIIAPLVFSVLVVGIAKVGDFKTVGRIGLKTIVYFTFATLVALAIGLILVNVFEPGKMMSLTLPTINAETGIKAAAQNSKNIISHVVPESIIRSMADNEILPIVVFAIFFGIATAAVGKQGEVVVAFFDSVSHIMFKITDYVMKFAPLGVFGALAAVIAKQGLGVLSGYLYLITCFYGGLLFFIFIIYVYYIKFIPMNFTKLLYC